MKFYEDQQLTKLIPDGECFSFGVVKVGDTKQLTLWLKNDDSPVITGKLIDLDFKIVCVDPTNDAPITEEKIDIVEAPKEMQPYAVVPLVLSWTPNIDLVQGMKAQMVVTAQKIVG